MTPSLRINLLHLANDFAGSKVYSQLVRELDILHQTQTIYVPVRHTQLVGRNTVDLRQQGSRIIYRHVLGRYTRIDFWHKIRRIYNDLAEQTDLSRIQLTHAHTWFSDGAVAERLYVLHGIPYVLTVRNTDLNLFLPYMLHLRNRGWSIARNARCIFFVSEAYRQRFLALKAVQHHLPDIADKVHVVPNGVSHYWLQNLQSAKHVWQSPIRALYVGNFTANKNVARLIEATEVVRSKGLDIQLTLVGGGGDHETHVLGQIHSKPWITFLGPIMDKDRLRQIYRDHDIFCMPSLTETFGLVFLEALSQGLPVLYTRGEGVDGLLPPQAGEKVNARDITDIALGLYKIASHPAAYQFNPSEMLQPYSWSHIAQQLLEHYQAAMAVRS